MKKYKEVKTNEESSKRVKRSIVLMSILILIGITIFIGTSYALFSIMINGEKKVSLETEEFKVDMEDGEYIKIDALGTMSDEEGKMSKPYTFTVKKNPGTIGAYYSLYLTEESGELNTYYLKYELKGTDGSIKEGRIGTLSRFNINQYLEAGRSVTYELRLWLDKDTPNSEQGNSYQSKIALEGSQIAKEGTVVFTYNGKEYNEKSDNNTVTIPVDLDSDENAKVLVCNNEAIPSYEDKTLTIKNITKETSCKTYSSLLEVSTQMDDTYSNIVLIKDENYTNEQIKFANKTGAIDLNGHVITFIPTNNSAGCLVYAFTGSNIVLKSSKASGGIITDYSNAEIHSNELVCAGRSGKLTMTSGYYGSNSKNSAFATVEVCSNGTNDYPILNIDGEEADNCTANIEDYHTGLCIYSERAAAVKNNGGSQSGIINIHGGSLVSNGSAYVTDAPGGETNIYGGYFRGNSCSVSTAGKNGNTKVNICGGDFASPVDIIATSNTIPIYYRNGINWQNGSNPIIEGTYKNNVQLKPDLNCSY